MEFETRLNSDAHVSWEGMQYTSPSKGKQKKKKTKHNPSLFLRAKSIMDSS